MAAATLLSAPEALTLISLPRFESRKAIKVGLFALLLRGVLRMEIEDRQGLLRKRQVIHLRVAPGAPAPLQPVSRSLVEVVRAAAPDGLMTAVVKQAIRTYGSTLTNFTRNLILPDLVRQGLAQARAERVLWIFPVTRYHPTAAGEAEKSRIEEAIRQASRIPEFLKEDPAQAAAIAAAAGSAILLVDALKPHYQALSQAMRPPSSGDGSGGGDSGSSDTDGGLDLGAIAGADAGFDFSAFDSFDAGFDAFDAGFDAACDAGGGDGGDGGGGDGGGGC